MTIEVRVLGSSGSYAGPDNSCSGYLVCSADTTVLLECGPGALGALQREVALGDIDAVVLTHCHPDHWLELPVLRNVFMYFVPRSGVPVFGTAETARMDDTLTVKAQSATDPFVWTVIDEHSEVQIGDQRWTFSRTDHPVETLAVRVDVDDKSFVFTSDTGPRWSAASLGEGIDLVLADASHLQEFENRGIPHCSAREAAIGAREANAGRLVLTHLIPGSDPEAHRAEAEAEYGGPVEVAKQGDRFTI